MIDLYDANNIMRRAYEQRGQLPGQRPMSLRMRYEQECMKQSIWVWDGFDHNARRREVYPKYKTNRSPLAEDVYAHVKLWREILTHTPATQVEVHGWEADDVIGTLVRRYPGRFRVHTNDMDYAQVGHLCQLVGVKDKGVPQRWVCLYKALVGDKSDNIEGIPGFGHKRWEEMEDWWPQIERAVVQGNPAAFVGLPFKPAVQSWLTSEDNVKLLQAMLTVTHFVNVPDDELEGGIRVGQLDRMAAHARLSEFFL